MKAIALSSLLAMGLVASGHANGVTTTSTNDGPWFPPPNIWSAGMPGPADTAVINNAVSLTSTSEVDVLNLNLTPQGMLSITGGPLEATGSNSLWVAGVLADGTLVQSGVLTLESTNGTELLGAVLRNRGLITDRDRALDISFGSRIENAGTFDLVDDIGFIGVGGSGANPVFINTGTFRKSAGLGVSAFDNNVEFDNRGGVVDVESGRVRLGNGSSSGGTFIVSGGSVLDLTGGLNPIYSGDYTGIGSGRIELNSGSLNGSPGCAFDFPTNLFVWIGGSIIGVVSNLNALTIVGTNAPQLAGARLRNEGLIQHQSGSLNISFGSEVDNAGTYEFMGDTSIEGTGGSGSAPLFNNLGLLQKSGGTNTASFSSANQVNNSGTIEAQTGTLYFGAGYTQTAGTTHLAGGVLGAGATIQIQGGVVTGIGALNGDLANTGGSVNPGDSTGAINLNGDYTQGAGGALNVALAGYAPGKFDQLLVSGSAALGGALNVTLVAPFTPATGRSFQILSSTNLTGAFSSFSALPGIGVAYSNNSVFLVVTGTVPVTLVGPAIVGTSFTFTFQSLVGKTYTVQYKDDLAAAGWTFYETIPGDGAVKTVVQSAKGVTHRFFRLLEE